MKRSNGLIAAGTVLSLVATLDMLLSPESVSLIDLVLRMSYVGTSFEFPSLFNMTFRLFPLFAFQAIMGNSYYDYFCTGSVYYFSRCQLRKKWLAKKQFELLLASILYSAFLLVPSLLILIMQQRLMLSRTAQLPDIMLPSFLSGSLSRQQQSIFCLSRSRKLRAMLLL